MVGLRPTPPGGGLPLSVTIPERGHPGPARRFDAVARGYGDLAGSNGHESNGHGSNGHDGSPMVAAGGKIGGRWGWTWVLFGVAFLAFGPALGLMSPAAWAIAPGWTIQAAPVADGATGGGLYGVSCPLTTVCTAVGVSVDGSGLGTLAEAWNGEKWQVEPTPNPTGASLSTLDAVSCTSATACMAVGYYYDSKGNFPRPRAGTARSG